MQTKQSAYPNKKPIGQRGNPTGNLKIPWDKWQLKKHTYKSMGCNKAVTAVLSDAGLL